jgi:hypothetical protein
LALNVPFCLFSRNIIGAMPILFQFQKINSFFFWEQENIISYLFMAQTDEEPFFYVAYSQIPFEFSFPNSKFIVTGL